MCLKISVDNHLKTSALHFPFFLSQITTAYSLWAVLRVFGKLLWYAEPVSYSGLHAVTYCHQRKPRFFIARKSANKKTWPLAHLLCKEKTDKFIPTRLRQHSGSKTVSSILGRLWCAKYPHNTLRILSGKPNFTAHRLMTVGCKLSHRLVLLAVFLSQICPALTELSALLLMRLSMCFDFLSSQPVPQSYLCWQYRVMWWIGY